MKCIILNVNTQTRWKGVPISNVILTAVKFDRDENPKRANTFKGALLGIEKDFKKAKVEFFQEMENKITNQQYVDFINKFLRLRTMEAETSEQRMKRRLGV